MEPSEGLEQASLLAEKISPEETRLLLERLGQRDLGGPEEATLGDLVEATGADPITVGSLLGQIRKEAFESRFERTFGQHETRIERLEETVQTTPSALSEADRQRIVEVVSQDRQQKQAKGLAGAFVMILVMLAALLVYISMQQPGPPAPGTYYLPEKNGDEIEVRPGQPLRVHQKDGTYREPTDDEKTQAALFHPAR